MQLISRGSSLLPRSKSIAKRSGDEVQHKASNLLQSRARALLQSNLLIFLSLILNNATIAMVWLIKSGTLLENQCLNLTT